jgi:hypothetical protein
MLNRSNPGARRAGPANPDPRRRALLGALAAAPWIGLAASLPGCGGGGGATTSTPAATSSTPPTPGVSAAATRTWKMGFSGDPPLPTAESLMAGIEQWRKRAEFAVMKPDLPWAELLAGVPAQELVQRDTVPLADYYRSKGLQIVYMADVGNGLSRSEEAPGLRSLNRSITELPVQQAFRDHVLAVSRWVKPNAIGLALETNLTRACAPAALYSAIRATANAAAADLRAAGSTATLLTSVQVETAWGKLAGDGSFNGIVTDLADFPFIQQIGLSSYPYFAFSQPEDMPADYYSRVVASSGLRAIVVEGGWTSTTVDTHVSSPDLQARYITRQAKLLDSIAALGVAQSIYADPVLSSLPQPLPDNLGLFAHVGLADGDFKAKPALAAWDALFERPWSG